MLIELSFLKDDIRLGRKATSSDCATRLKEYSILKMIQLATRSDMSHVDISMCHADGSVSSYCIFNGGEVFRRFRKNYARRKGYLHRAMDVTPAKFEAVHRYLETQRTKKLKFSMRGMLGCALPSWVNTLPENTTFCSHLVTSALIVGKVFPASEDTAKRLGIRGILDPAKTSPGRLFRYLQNNSETLVVTIAANPACVV